MAKHKNFRHLHVPDHWEQYWSKYPNGYTILEALINWVSQVDNMVDNVNDWNDYLDDFVGRFDKDLQKTVEETLRAWQKDGTLKIIIDEALQSQLDDFRKEFNNDLDNKAGKTYVDNIVENINDRIADITTTPAEGISEQEIIDAREGKTSLGKNVRDIRKRTNTTIKNRLKNGDFEPGAPLDDYGWFWGTAQRDEYIEGLEEIGSVVLTSKGEVSYNGALIYQKLLDNPPGHDKWYVNTRVRALDNNIVYLITGFRGIEGNDYSFYGQDQPITSMKWYNISHLYDPQKATRELEGEFRAYVNGAYDSNVNTDGFRIQIDNIVAFNLTEVFGRGNEPTKETMDRAMATIPRQYFEELDAGQLSHIAYREAVRQDNVSSKLEHDIEVNNQTDLVNSLKNSDFKNNNEHWTSQASGNNFTASDRAYGVVTMTPTGANHIPQLYQKTDIPHIEGRRVYVRGTFKPLTTDAEMATLLFHGEDLGTTQQFINKEDLRPNRENTVSGTFIARETSGNVGVRFRLRYPDKETAEGKKFELSKLLVLDLTAIFGAGNEPEHAQIDYIVDNLPSGWYDYKPKTNDLQYSIMKYIFNHGGGGGGGIKQPLLVLSFDDGFKTDLDIVYPMLKERGISGTSFINGGHVGNNGGIQRRMSWEDIKFLKQNNWDTQCHYLTHPHLNDLTDQEIIEELEDNTQAFLDNGLPAPEHTAYPYGEHSSRVRDVSKDFRKSLRRINPSGGTPYNTWEDIDFYNLSARGTDIRDANIERLEERKQDIDLTVENNGILIFFSHEFVEDAEIYETEPAYYEELIDYAISKGIKFVTISEMYDLVQLYRGV